MTATPLLDKSRNDCRLCGFSADSLNTRVDAFNFVVVKTKTLKISAPQTPAARSRPIQSSPTGRNGPRGRLTSSHARLSSRQNPHRRRVRRTTQPSQPAVSSLGGFRTPAPVHVERFVTGRHPKTFTISDAILTDRHGRLLRVQRPFPARLQDSWHLVAHL